MFQFQLKLKLFILIQRETHQNTHKNTMNWTRSHGRLIRLRIKYAIVFLLEK